MSTKSSLENSWTNQQLYIETIPRGVFFSYVQVFLLTGSLPFSNISPKQYKILPHDPFSWLSYSYKNHQLPITEYLNLYINPILQNIFWESYGAYSQYIGIKKLPFWANYAISSNWYEKQLKIYKQLQFLYFAMPGLKNIFLTASSTIDLQDNNSDVDLIIQTKGNYVWFNRIIIKIFLKITGRDVHRFRSEIIIFIANYLTSNNLTKKISKYLEKQAREKIYRYKNRAGTKYDIGLIYSNNSVLPKLFKKESKHVLFATTLRLNYSKKEIENHPFFNFGEIRYSPYLNIRTKFFAYITKLFLYLIFLILQPITYLIFRLYQKKHQNNPNFLVSWSTICYYPLIYKDGYFRKV
jgi:hypothetical protein